MDTTSANNIKMAIDGFAAHVRLLATSQPQFINLFGELYNVNTIMHAKWNSTTKQLTMTVTGMSQQITLEGEDGEALWKWLESHRVQLSQ